MPKIDVTKVPTRVGAGYPSPYDEPIRTRRRQFLMARSGISAFGVNRLTLPPGGWSSQRHWHSHEDEFVMVLQGEVVLVTDAGEELLRAGDCAAFKASDPDGHQLINRSDADAVVLEAGGNDPERDRTVYSDVDLVLEPAGFTHKDGTPYPVKKLDLAAISLEGGCNYPPPYDAPCLGATWRKLGRHAGLSFGVNLSTLPPGAWTSQRHWHSVEDEFVYVIEGELTLVTDAGETVMRAGDCAAFKAGDTDGHCLINRSVADAILLEVGTSDLAHDRCVYSDIDMVAEPAEPGYRHRDGTPYPINEG